MRRIIFLLLFSARLQAQEWCIFDFTYIGFDDGFCLGNFYIDTLTWPDNTWQLGVPGKAPFEPNSWGPLAMVTDTVQPYPPGNNSVLDIKTLHMEDIFSQANYVWISADYQVDSDSLNDFGTIAFSPDNGSTWIDLLNDPVYAPQVIWHSDKPVLTGRSSGFMSFEITALVWQLDIGFLDTVAYRFAFQSDEIPEERAGLMLDNFYFQHEFVGDADATSPPDIGTAIIPNPAEGSASLLLDVPPPHGLHCYITDMMGRMILDFPVVSGETPIELDRLPAGWLLYRVLDQDGALRAQGPFIRH